MNFFQFGFSSNKVRLCTMIAIFEANEDIYSIKFGYYISVNTETKSLKLRLMFKKMHFCLNHQIKFLHFYFWVDGFPCLIAGLYVKILKSLWISFAVDETKPITFTGQHSEPPNSNKVKAIPNIYSSIPTKDDNDQSFVKVCLIYSIRKLVIHILKHPSTCFDTYNVHFSHIKILWELS